MLDKIQYTSEKMNKVRTQVQKIYEIVGELQSDFPGRSFTPDGHLVGSIGEVMASYHYGIALYKASNEVHDGIVDGREVQIKLTQGSKIQIRHKPDYLIVLYMTSAGHVYEIYNGSGDRAWRVVGKKSSNNSYTMSVGRLMAVDAEVDKDERIKAIHHIDKMKPEYKNN